MSVFRLKFACYFSLHFMLLSQVVLFDLKTAAPLSLKTSFDNFTENKDLIFCPTDTVFGILCTDKNKIYEAKNRNYNIPLQILGHRNYFFKLFNGYQNEARDLLIENFWPGGLSIVCDSSIGRECFREPNHKFLLSLLEDVYEPVFASSLNISGQNELWDKNEILGFAESLDKPVLVFHEPKEKNLASTVIDLKKEDGFFLLKFLRVGDISKEKILQVLSQKFLVHQKDDHLFELQF